MGCVEVITRPYTLHVSEAAASPNKLPACHHSHLKSSHPKSLQRCHPDSLQRCHPNSLQSCHPNSLQRCHPGSLQCCHPDRTGGISLCRQRLSPRLPVQKILRLRREPPAAYFEAIKNPSRFRNWGFYFFRILAMTYSHMGKPHTTIGDEPFHY